jgi:hypothetical protein
MYFLKPLIYLVAIFVSSFSFDSVAQDCPSNTVPLSDSYYYGSAPSASTPSLACDNHWDTFDAGGGYKISYNFDATTNSCAVSWNSGWSRTSNPTLMTNSGGGSCGCSDGQLAATNGAGDVTSCMDIADVPDANDCQDSWDQLAGNCGTVPEECAASGGSFGWNNGVPICADASSGDGDVPPTCEAGESLVYGALGSEGSFTCVADPIPDEGCPLGTVEINGQCIVPAPQTTGCTFEGAADSDCDDIQDRFDPESRGSEGGASETGGTRESIDIDGVVTTESCNPSKDADCVANAGNSGAGQCDPESVNYLQCITGDSGGTFASYGELPTVDKDKTFASELTRLRTGVNDSDIVGAVGAMYGISLTGSCPVWSVDTWIFSISFDHLCSNIIPWDIISGVLFLASIIIGWRIALT